MRRALLPSLMLALAACGDSPPRPVPVAQADGDGPTAPADANAGGAKTSETKAKPTIKTKSKEVAATFDAQLAALDERIAKQVKVAEGNGRSPTIFGMVASLYLARARLSGDYDDYARAEEILDRAFSVGGKEGFGPFMVRARLNFTLHRLDRVDQDFELAIRLPARSGAERFRRAQFAGNLAFQRGEYEQALTNLEAALSAKPTLSALSSLAVYHWKTGDFDEAETLLSQALEAYKGKETEPRAWVHLQRGLMDLDRGRYEDALAHYRAGEDLMKGYWLIEEHIAEILTLTGKTEQAQALYRSIIERTQNPEFMDAMAGIARDAGDEAGAKEWIAKARARYEQQSQRFPEAAYGHALEHYLEFGDDPAKTLEMAKNNHALRPNADAKRLLAEAHLAAGQKKEARTVIEQALASPMRSADLYATAHAVYAATGNEAKAEEYGRKAREINPKIELLSEPAAP